jgi:hypothetical protein
VRSASWVDDGRFVKGQTVALPTAAVADATRLLYVFEGSVTVDGVELTRGESAILPSSTRGLRTLEHSDLVLLSSDERAPVFRGGMFSGNMVGLG